LGRGRNVNKRSKTQGVGVGGGGKRGPGSPLNCGGEKAPRPKVKKLRSGPGRRLGGRQMQAKEPSKPSKEIRWSKRGSISTTIRGLTRPSEGWRRCLWFLLPEELYCLPLICLNGHQRGRLYGVDKIMPKKKRKGDKRCQ